LGQPPAVFSGAFWNRSPKTPETPKFDLYADTATAARPHAAEELARASRDSRSAARDPVKNTQNPSREELLAQSDQSPDVLRARSTGTSSGTKDSSIRVTLERPESLPTTTDRPVAADSILASAPPTNWKRSSDSAGSFRGSGADLDSGTSSRSRPSRLARREDDQVRRQGNRQAGPQSGDGKLHDILVGARNRLAALSTYQVNITRVERVGGQLQAEEDVLLSIRRNPKAVRLEWTSGQSKGREVIYSSALSDHTMYVNMANSSLPIPRMSIPVDSPLALRNSRHPITEAGFDAIIENLSRHEESASVRGAAEGRLVYKGIEKPKGLNEPCHLLERVTPEGETWQVYLETRTLLPAVAVAFQTASGEVIERYTYRNVKPNPAELASAEAFDPDKRWRHSTSLLSRLARSAGAPGDASSGSTKTR
jgi:hypothetical protein